MAAVDWSKETTSSLISIGTHSLFLRAAGPPRQPGVPAVIVEAGLGDSSVSWTAVARHVASFARIYTYDRSGLGQSEPSALPRNASNIALELTTLLRSADIAPPYILVMQSYGGIPGREFAGMEENNLRGKVVGMVFVETNTEFTGKGRPEGLMGVMGVLFGGLDVFDVTKVGQRHGMLREEYAAVMADEDEEVSKKQNEASGGEMQNYTSSLEALAARKQYELTPPLLGDYPVVVIQGDIKWEMEMMYEAAVERGNGTEQQRKVVADWLVDVDETEGKLQKEQLRLSTKGRMERARKSGHNVHLFEPELVAEMIQWVIEVGNKE